jgi:starch-binding outer membrane protein, SusD/RagB family
MMNFLKTRAVRRSFGAAVAVVLVGGTTACDSFFEVRTPGVVEASSLDPIADGPMFAASAFQSLTAAIPNTIIYGSWFTGESRVGDTFPTRNEFGRRTVSETNSSLSADVWNPLVRAIAAGEVVVELLDGSPGADLSVARGALTSGFGLVFLGESFCEGTMRGPGGVPGNKMTQAELIQAAITRFDKAIASATAAGASGASIADAARVGKGRALLQLRRGAEAAQAVTGVAPTFAFNLVYVDQSDARARLSNGVFGSSFRGTRPNLVVSPFIRGIGRDITGAPANPTGDPRMQFLNTNSFGQDQELPFFDQRKINSWADGIRLASGLEAQYIAVEGRNQPAEMLAFVNERRAVGGEGPYAGSNLLGEFLRQRTIDFWLEGKRMGDLQRHGNLLPGLTPPGDYYKANIGAVGTGTCYPIPQSEKTANPNIN